MLIGSERARAPGIAAEAERRVEELGLADLPPRLRRNSRDYYYLSVWPGLLQLGRPPAEIPWPARVESGYVHLPFCSGLCDFCSYFVVVAREAQTDPRIPRHVDDLLRELELNQARFEVELSYLYLGGGTPSLLPPDQLERLLTGFRGAGALAPRLLGTAELHPELFGDEARADAFLDVLEEFGIRRVSIGFQTADEDLLDGTNRRHGADFAPLALERLRTRGFMVNLDLMYGLPDQSLASWVASLERVLELAPDSISTYFMFLDPGTKLRHDVETGAVTLPAHELVQAQHVAAQLVLEEAGFVELPGDFWSKPEESAELTQAALPSEGASLGLGAGAYGYYSGMQYFNEFALAPYRRALGDGRVPHWRAGVLTAEQQRCRDVMFSLKNSPCLRADLFEAAHGAAPLDAFPEQFALLDRLELASVDGGVVRLTPKGRLLVEEIACLFEPPGHHASAPAGDVRLRRHNFAPTYSAAT
jgi:oxygen-independent coproporphyrinogen-3 oxidase